MLKEVTGDIYGQPLKWSRMGWLRTTTMPTG